jgi:hypothetical protein
MHRLGASTGPEVDRPYAPPVMQAGEWMGSSVARARTPWIGRTVTFALAVLLIAWLAAALAAVILPMAAGILGVTAGIALGRLAAGDERIGLTLAFLPAVLLHGTGLVPSAGSYVPSLSPTPSGGHRLRTPRAR